MGFHTCTPSVVFFFYKKKTYLICFGRLCSVALPYSKYGVLEEKTFALKNAILD